MAKKYRIPFALAGGAAGALSLALVALGLCAEKGWIVAKQPAWVSWVCLGAAAVALCAILILIGAWMRPAKGRPASLLQKLCFSDLLLEKSPAHIVAYLGVVAALCIVTNMFEIKFATTQFSLTLFSSALAGILLGPVAGFCAVFLGDGVGYLVNSMGYPYYWWVALSCALMAVAAGLCMRLPLRGTRGLYAKLAIACAVILVVCSAGVNSAGMYFIGLKLYMPQDVLQAFQERFGGAQTFGIYLIVRFFLLGQIWNSLVNYALLFLAVPALARIGTLRLTQ